MRMPAAQTLTICSGVAFRPRVKAPRSALPSMLTTPLMAKPLLNLRRTVSRPFGSSARRTLLNVSWLGIPCLSSRNRRNNSNRPWPKNSNSVQLLAPASVAASAMITMSSRSCRVLSARGSLSGRSRRLSLRIQVSLNRETPQNPVPTALQHLSSAICDSPTLQGRISKSPPLLFIRLEMRIRDAQLWHRDLGGVGARDEIADHMIGLDRQARFDVAKHRGGHRRAFGGQQTAGTLEEWAGRRVARRLRDRAAFIEHAE